MSHEDVVRQLLSLGACPHRANHLGGTCLMNAVQSARLVALLLARGAAPDARDAAGRTALHYAAREHRAHTVRLLLARGADPTLREREGDDVLRTAALKGAAQVVSLLTSRGQFPPGEAADALELLGSTQLDEFGDVEACRGCWRRATALRVMCRAPKPQHRAPAALSRATEWRSAGELDALDRDQLRLQALLVAERVLGATHRDVIYRVMYRGAAYAEAGRMRRAAELWLWALELRLERDTLLHPDTYHTAAALARLLVQWTGPQWFRFTFADRILQLITDALPDAQEALEPQPRCKKQTETFDRMVRCASHMLHLLHGSAAGPQQLQQLNQLQDRLLALRPRLRHTGDSMLHLVVSRMNVVRGGGAGAEGLPVFPCVPTVRALLGAGASPHARNTAGCTPLHCAAIPGNRNMEVVSMLLDAGAHLDQPNRFGDSAAGLLRSSQVSLVWQHESLRCLAARALCSQEDEVLHALDPLLRRLPRTLRRFLALHRRDPDEEDLGELGNF